MYCYPVPTKEKTYVLTERESIQQVNSRYLGVSFVLLYREDNPDLVNIIADIQMHLLDLH